MPRSAPGSSVEIARERIGSIRFDLRRLLGSGGAGAVFEAVERESGARVALKILSEPTGLAILRFKQEFRTLAEFAHPNVVRFGELFEEGGQYFFTMELVEGESLLEFARPGSTLPDTVHLPSSAAHAVPESGISRPFPSARRPALGGVLHVERLRDALAQLAGGLIALHAVGLVHRDVKPQNVLVTADGRVVLLDFGVAMSLEDSSQAELAGTYAYMAPEQAMGGDVGAAADWYAFGAVLYEALTGRLPHSHLPFRNFWEESRAPLPPPESYVSGLPADLCALAMSLLCFSPAERLDEASIAAELGVDVASERARTSLRTQVQFPRRPFVARDHELSALRAAVERARSGSAPIVYIEGESGIGKSRLIRQLLSEIGRESDVLVLSSRCHEREAVPYRGIDGVIDALVRALEQASRTFGVLAPPVDAEFLAEVFPVLRALPGFEDMVRPELFELDPNDARQRVFQALKRLFEAICRERPVLIHLDDAQWIDAGSLALLEHLVREPVSRCVLVVAARPNPAVNLEAMWKDSADASKLVLAPLSFEESKALVARMLELDGAPVGLDADAIARKSGGHPLFINELVTYESSREAPAENLEGALAARIRTLDENALRLLELVAVAAAPICHAVARAASELAPESYPWVLSTLRGENLLSFQALSNRDLVHVYHDRIQELVRSELDAGSRRSLHGRLAEAIERLTPDDLDSLAHHFAGAGRAEPAARYARAAGERALSKLAFENAAALFRLALEHESAAPAQAELEERLGQSLASAGRGAEAAEVYLRAAELSSDATAIEYRRRAGEQLLRVGCVKQGTEILFAVLRELGLSLPETDLLTVLSLTASLIRIRRGALTTRARQEPTVEDRLRLDACWTVATGLSLVHHLRATDFQARALLLALRAKDTDRVIKSAALLGVALAASDGPPRKVGAELRGRAKALASAVPSDENAAWLELTDGVAAMGDWDFAGCERLCAQAETTLRNRCSGAAWEIVTAQAFGLWSATFRGNFRAAAARLPELLAAARARGDRHAETALVLSPVHLLGLAADEPERVERETRRCMAEWPSELAPFQHMCGAYVLAQVELYRSNLESAWQHVSYAWKMVRKAHLSRVQFQRVDLLSLRARTALARAAASTGSDKKEWLAQAKGDAGKLRGEDIAASHALANLVEGGVLRLTSDERGAATCFGKAASGFDGLGMVLHARVAQLSLARLGAGREEIDAAERALSELGVANGDGMMRLWSPAV